MVEWYPMQDKQNKKILIALGGNAIITEKQTGTYAEQITSVATTTRLLAELVKQEYKLVISHGNGPQVGNLLIQHACAADQVPELPMDICGAQSQGQIGYLLQQQFKNSLAQMNIDKNVCTIVTQTVVAANDPSFKNPSKPVGPFYTMDQVAEKQAQGFVYKEDAGRGYRRIVPSPQPIGLVELPIIKELYESGAVVIAGGGGGVPVVLENDIYRGVEAVIDKDKSSALLAAELNVDVFIILTGVDQIALHFNTPQQKNIANMTVGEAQKYIQEGHFVPGSMLPKVEAAIDFVQKTKRRALITSPSTLFEALNNNSGTWVSE